MKTIDTKSLLLGVGLTFLVLTLISGKLSEESDNLEVSEGNAVTTVFNKQTKTVYYYYKNITGRPNNKPNFTAKVSPDGSGLIVE